MQLRLKRTQREGGVVSKNVIFCLTARVHFTDQERSNLQKYKLWNQVIYNSESSKQSLAKSEAAYASGSTGGYLKSMVHTAMAAMKLNISVKSLEQGQYVECKNMDELLAAEDAVYQACGNLKEYLALAATFDGTEIIVDFDQERPEIVAHPAIASPAPLAALPKAAPAPVAAIAAPGAEAVAQAAHAEAAEVDPGGYTEYEAVPDTYALADGGSFADQDSLQELKNLWDRHPVLIVCTVLFVLLVLYTCS